MKNNAIISIAYLVTWTGFICFIGKIEFFLIYCLYNNCFLIPNKGNTTFSTTDKRNYLDLNFCIYLRIKVSLFRRRMITINGEITLCIVSLIIKFVLPVCHQMSLYKICKRKHFTIYHCSPTKVCHIFIFYLYGIYFAYLQYIFQL